MNCSSVDSDAQAHSVAHSHSEHFSALQHKLIVSHVGE